MYYPLYPHHIPKYSPMFIPMISPLHSHCMPLYHSFCWLIPIKSPLNPHYLFFYKSNHENHHHSHDISIESFENNEMTGFPTPGFPSDGFKDRPQSADATHVNVDEFQHGWTSFRPQVILGCILFGKQKPFGEIVTDISICIYIYN